MTASRPGDPFGGRIAWHATARDLARALRESRGGGRVYVFDIPPRLMRGLYAAAFHGEDGAVHRFLAPYYDPAALREEIQPIQQAVRWMGLRAVDGRLEVGANTGDLLHYFLANADDAPGASEATERRRQSREAWLDAVRELGGRDLRLRSVPGPGAGPVLVATAGGEHLLIRLEEEAGSVAEVLRRLGRPGKEAVRSLGAGGALYRDIMGEWAGRQEGA